ncbi:hypothetical protein Barb4_02772 [Bacteroidales bacterium Barb4]|nr:hypothetical protein Barb4_02772 [Bacteroidales bacterium Barb4]
MQYIILSSFQDTPDGVVPVTPHSAPLHVGLKSCILSGYPEIPRLCRKLSVFVQKVTLICRQP